MVDAGVQGHIVNLSSAAGYTPSRMLPAYSTTKAAVLMLSECMRAELADSGIGVTAICPGIVNTNITRTTHMVGVDADQERRMQERGARAYAARGYPPEKVAEAILGAVRRNPAVLPVTPEARLMRTMSQLTPGLVRAFARLDPGSSGRLSSGR
jgi:NAD(P)-dependent dehydrogenase (short-subunit alcohol dehydrogenase family)